MSRRRRHRTSRQRPPDCAQPCAGGPETILRDAGPRPAARDEGLVEAPAVTIRIAQTDDDVAAIHRFMIAHAACEMAEAEVDALIYMRTIHDTVTQGAGLIAMINGEIAGYLGLWKSQYDYSKASFLHDRGFYVLPAHRDGSAARALLREARSIADAAGLGLKIIDTNPTRRRRARSRSALSAEILGYAPAGRIITFHHPNKA